MLPEATDQTPPRPWEDTRQVLEDTAPPVEGTVLEDAPPVEGTVLEGTVLKVDIVLEEDTAVAVPGLEEGIGLGPGSCLLDRVALHWGSYRILLADGSVSR